MAAARLARQRAPPDQPRAFARAGRAAGRAARIPAVIGCGPRWRSRHARAGLAAAGRGQRQRPFFPVAHPLAQRGVLAQQACEPASRAPRWYAGHVIRGRAVLQIRGRCSSFHAPEAAAGGVSALYVPAAASRRAAMSGCARSSKNAIAMATRRRPSSSPIRGRQAVARFRLARRRRRARGVVGEGQRQRVVRVRQLQTRATQAVDTRLRTMRVIQVMGWLWSGRYCPACRQNRENTPAARPRRGRVSQHTSGERI